METISACFLTKIFSHLPGFEISSQLFLSLLWKEIVSCENPQVSLRQLVLSGFRGLRLTSSGLSCVALNSVTLNSI